MLFHLGDGLAKHFSAAGKVSICGVLKGLELAFEKETFHI